MFLTFPNNLKLSPSSSQIPPLESGVKCTDFRCALGPFRYRRHPASIRTYFNPIEAAWPLGTFKSEIKNHSPTFFHSPIPITSHRPRKHPETQENQENPQKMVSKKSSNAATPATAQTPLQPSTNNASTAPVATPKPKGSSKNRQSGWALASGVWNSYVENTAQRTKLIDVFMAFLVVVGGLQFVYCLLAGNYPFNAFLAGFGATVGQFVLTASLRMQTDLANKAEFSTVSPERAFADYIFGSMLLHFFCVNFIN